MNLPDIRVNGPPGSPALIDRGVDHDVDRRVDFTIVVDPTALASPDDTAEAQDALFEDQRPETSAADETTEEGAAEAAESLAGELGLDDVEVVDPEPSAVAATLGAIARRRRTITELAAQDCRYPISSEPVRDEYGCTRVIHQFCGSPRTIGFYCARHHDETHTPVTPRQVREQQRASEKLSRLAIVAALKRE